MSRIENRTDGRNLEERQASVPRIHRRNHQSSNMCLRPHRDLVSVKAKAAISSWQNRRSQDS